MHTEDEKCSYVEIKGVDHLMAAQPGDSDCPMASLKAYLDKLNPECTTLLVCVKDGQYGPELYSEKLSASFIKVVEEGVIYRLVNCGVISKIDAKKFNRNSLFGWWSLQERVVLSTTLHLAFYQSVGIAANYWYNRAGGHYFKV